MLMSYFCIGWIKRCETRSDYAKEKATKKTRSKADVKKTRRCRRLRQQRRQTQTRIRNWQSTRKLTYDGSGGSNQQGEARTYRGNQGWRRRTQGGAGWKPLARPVYASSIEEGVLKGIGVPQNTWGDGSCWLWAVAGALGMLEGKEGPTDKDIRLEREWRGAIRDTVRERGIPMTEDDINGLNEGVQYEQG
eukprot:2515284-Pleurochrysis_carterae.AAC.1